MEVLCSYKVTDKQRVHCITTGPLTVFVSVADMYMYVQLNSNLGTP